MDFYGRDPAARSSSVLRRSTLARFVRIALRATQLSLTCRSDSQRFIPVLSRRAQALRLLLKPRVQDRPLPFKLREALACRSQARFERLSPRSRQRALSLFCSRVAPSSKAFASAAASRSRSTASSALRSCASWRASCSERVAASTAAGRLGLTDQKLMALGLELHRGR
jgi:hypothetical protein